ncbi:hypothetical protein [Zobellia uliginosa]|uniref:hypothetical protein n=1 Tax=Zobellia uliginosa TaxID=143224 RepID=UPI0026E1B4E7|nr:hypothetical protein [Zobellia uliginosa]MDO6515846.1 hypothetical protein [Zobellia uliginosa]
MKEKKENKTLFPNYWAGRVPIYLIMGLIPLLAGIMHLSLYFDYDENYFKGREYSLKTTEVKRPPSLSKFILAITTHERTVSDTLEYDAWYHLLGYYGGPDPRQRTQNTENIKHALDRIKKEKPILKYHYNETEKKLTGLKIDGKTILSHYNHLLLGLVFTALGIFMIGGMLYLIIKDPNKWYKEVKDPFYKYKK